MNIFIFIGQMIDGVVDADTLADAFRKCHEFEAANKFRLVGDGVDMTGIPNMDGKRISWSKS